jgi:RDD family
MLQMNVEVTMLLGVLLLPAIAFALVYSGMVTHLSRGLLSLYLKADVRRRLTAAFIDGLMAVTLCLVCWTVVGLLSNAAGGAYLLLRDAIGGQSIGKLLLGLLVIDLETGRVSSLSGSIRRNLLLLLPGANVVAIFLEARTIIIDPQGQRLGNRLDSRIALAGCTPIRSAVGEP